MNYLEFTVILYLVISYSIISKLDTISQNLVAMRLLIGLILTHISRRNIV